MDINLIKFDENGLIPAVIQDNSSGRVLTVAYMNRESLEISLKEGRTCFWSRSRGKLWRKGEESGNVQHVVSIAADCDHDALLVRVNKDGPACHLGKDSCFSNPILEGAEPFGLQTLYALLAERRDLRPEGSYTSYLFDSGREKILKKLGEECTETVIAAMKDSEEETVFELADLCYHALVLMAEMRIEPSEVLKKLESRHVIDKKVKQQTMK